MKCRSGTKTETEVVIYCFEKRSNENSITEKLYFFYFTMVLIMRFMPFSGSYARPRDLLAIQEKSLDRASFLYVFIREVRSSGVSAPISIVRIRKFYKMLQNLVPS